MAEGKRPSKEQDWAHLMVLVQAGEADAYARLLRELSVHVRALVRSKLNDEAQVDDLVQDVLLAVHRARHTYQSSRPFLPWLHAIIRFRLTDHLRRVYRGRHFEELDLDRDYHETLPPPPANEECDASLLDALGRLPDKQRRAVQLLKLDGLSVKEAAAQVGMSESALKVNAHRAYKTLRQWLTKWRESDAR